MMFGRLNLISKIRLIRPVNCLMMGFAVFVGAYLAHPTMSLNAYSLKLLRGFITGFSLTGASMAINDYFDRFIDAVNQPTRPIPSGAVKPKEALVYASLLIILGFAATLWVNLPSFLTALAAWILFLTYTVKGKRMGFLGNLMVSACVAIPFIYGSLVVDKFNLNIVFFASMAFLSNTGREVTKGIVDVEGDELHGVKTIAVLKGKRTAAYLASALYFSAVGLSILPPVLRLVSTGYVVVVALADLGFIVSSTFLLKNPSGENAQRIKQLVLVWMLLGLTAFLLG